MMGNGFQRSRRYIFCANGVLVPKIGLKYAFKFGEETKMMLQLRLSQRWFLWSLYWINLLGTLYGYIWYGKQIVYTVSTMPLWLLPFVPDSPTASLFFTAALSFLIRDQARQGKPPMNRYGQSSELRGFVEAFAAVTSVKYGIWAVAMIAAGGWQGNPLGWKDWMLVGSHLGMAAEAFLFVQFFGFRLIQFGLVAFWTLLNDVMDYHFYQVYPWLPDVLQDDLGSIEWFTIALSLLSLACVYWVYWRGRAEAAAHN